MKKSKKKPLTKVRDYILFMHMSIDVNKYYDKNIISK